MKLQLFKFTESCVGLVDLSSSAMTENGEMNSWQLEKEKGTIHERKVTWEHLETSATIIEWTELTIKESPLRKLAFELLDKSQQKRAKMIGFLNVSSQKTYDSINKVKPKL